MESWTEPLVRWRTAIASDAQYQELLHQGARLARWPAAPFEDSDTDCFAVGSDYWIWQPGVGGIRFAAEPPEIDAFRSAAVSGLWFEHLVMRSWLPAVYQVWGRQVLHASAASRTATGEAIAFAGPSGAGKSTLAFGLARRAGWEQIADDTLAFSWTKRQLVLHPLRNEVRLRPSAADHYGRQVDLPEPVRWPSSPPRLRRICFLVGGESDDVAASLRPLRPSESYRLLLEQAHALTLSVPTHNQQLMRDYLMLTAEVPAFRLRYRKSFDLVEDVFDLLEEHLPSNARSLAAQNTASTT